MFSFSVQAALLLLSLAPSNAFARIHQNADDAASQLQSNTYDYIIAGGGTAGCVLAARLSEDPAVSVLLLEQGPVADTWKNRVPLLSFNVYDRDDRTATWWTEPLAHAGGRFVQVVRGECLGGTSRINGMVYTRGASRGC